jgi:uncharacterized integral membrane protein
VVILVFALIIVALIVIFSIQNAAPVTISFLAWQFSASLAIVVFLALFCGILIMALLSAFMRLKGSRKRPLPEEESSNIKP